MKSKPNVWKLSTHTPCTTKLCSCLRTMCLQLIVNTSNHMVWTCHRTHTQQGSATGDLVNLEQMVQLNETRQTPNQCNVYTNMLAKVDSRQDGIMYIDAPGGTGKTFLLHLLLQLRYACGASMLLSRMRKVVQRFTYSLFSGKRNPVPASNFTQS